MTNTEKILEDKKDHIAYSPEVNLIRPILAKYMNEWSADMLGELAKILTESIAQALAEERKRVRGNLPEIKASPLSMLLNDCPICGQVINRSFVDDLTCRIQDEYKQKILSSLDKLTDK